MEVLPQIQSDTHMTTVSPTVERPDAVVLSPSGNGQNFASDVTLHARDQENTFTYYQDPSVYELSPAQGPVNGRSKLYVSGVGFQPF